MTIYIQIINGTIGNNLRLLLRRRILKLETYHSNIIAAYVILKKDNSSSDKSHHAEIRLSINGPDLFGKCKAANFEQAGADVIESLRKRLRKKSTE